MIRQAERENKENMTLYWEIFFKVLNHKKLSPKQYKEIEELIYKKLDEYNHDYISRI